MLIQFKILEIDVIAQAVLNLISIVYIQYSKDER